MYSKLVALLSLALVCASSAVPLANKDSQRLVKRIDAGSVFNSQGFDYIVYISLGNLPGDIRGCTGVLISSRHVLTQEKCLGLDPVSNDTNYKNLTVVISHTDVNNKRTSYNALVSNVYLSSQFSNKGYSTDIALLRLNAVVPASLASPVKIYAGDFKISTPAMLVGYATVGAPNSTTLMTQMRYENVNFQNSQYCLGANQYFDQNTEMCSQATSGLNSCNGDLGAPILVPVDNSGKSNSSNTSSGNPSLNTYALLALTSSSYSLLADPQLSCVYTGSTGFYSWIYPFINQIAAAAEMNITQIALLNNTLSSTPDPFLHPGIPFVNINSSNKKGGILNSAAGVAMLAAAMLAIVSM